MDAMTPYRSLNRIYGVISPTITSLISRDIDDLIDQLIVQAVDLWRLANWQRFDDLEINCTIQLFKWISEAKHRKRNLEILNVQLEYVLPTPEMMAGTQSAATMSRPDIRISIGQAAERLLECKRLSLSNSHPKLYVLQGMSRFLTEHYGGQARAAMIGYVQADNPRKVVVAINREVAATAGMGSGAQLRCGRSRQQSLYRYESIHHGTALTTVTLRHYILDLT